MPTTTAKIQRISRALFPRYGIQDVASLVATIVQQRNRDGHVKIWRPEGRFAWFASPASTHVTPSMVTLWFPADHRRTATQARDDLYRRLEDAALSVMPEDEMEAIIQSSVGPAISSTRPSRKKSTAQIKREIEEAMGSPAEGAHGAEASAGHIAWLDDGTREAYEQGGEVYIAPSDRPLDIHGYRQGGRWESSTAHWKRYFDALFKPRVSGPPQRTR